MEELKIVLASGNRHKYLELAKLFSELPAYGGKKVILLSPTDLPGEIPEVEETGESYEENALLKASAYARFAGIPALADDSGLEVVALHGAPGIRSARAAEGSDMDKIHWLLDKMREAADRRASFVACLAIALPDAQNSFGSVERDYFAVEGRCFGQIAYAPRGEYGFGFDPVFIPDGYEKTFSELGDEIKSKISHRAIALGGVAQIMPSVLEYIAVHKGIICNDHLGRCTDR